MTLRSILIISTAALNVHAAFRSIFSKSEPLMIMTAQSGSKFNLCNIEYELKDLISRDTDGKRKLYSATTVGGNQVLVKFLEAGQKATRELAMMRNMEGSKHSVDIYCSKIFPKQGTAAIVMEHPSTKGFLSQRTLPQKNMAKLDEMVYQFSRMAIDLKKREIINRNIKPSTLFIGQDGNIKLFDYSLAVDSRWAQSDHQWGDLEYTAPELALKNKYSYSVDIWSAGVTMFKVATGDFPFHLNRAEDLASEYQRAAHAANILSTHGINQDTSTIIATMLGSPQDRERFYQL